MARRDRELNRRSWNAATVAHNSHKGDQAAWLRRRGTSTLFPEELELLGPLRGKRGLHLQCNAGQDTLSLAKRGAQVTGVDISDEAIRFAGVLSAESGISARFVRSDVYDFLAANRARFDFVFCSYGVVGWLDDLQAWAQGISRSLKRGGAFVYVDFHPAPWVFDEQVRPRWPYSSQGHSIGGTGVTDYVARSREQLVPWGFEEGVQGFANPHRSAEFAWGLGEIVQAGLDAGMRLEVLREYPYANGYAVFEGMQRVGRRFFPATAQPRLPLMFGLRLRRA